MNPAPRTIGGYVIEAKLGAGGMGTVYRATHPRAPGHRFALKVLISDEYPTAEQAERFAREMKALAAVAHPNVVRIVGGGIDQNKPFYVMELVQGTPLSKLAHAQPLEPRRAVAIVRAVADAIAFIHGQGIIHRDLKPDNIMVEAGDRPRILDFGLARIADLERLTRSGTMMGTPAYSAPEQLDGRAHEVDGRADVYAIGAVLWYALTGRAPFQADSSVALIKSVLVEPVRRPSVHAPAVPVEVDAICLHALEKDPKDRYASAADLCADLDRFLRGEPVVAPTLNSLDELARVTKRREVKLGLRGGVALGALAVLALLATFVAYPFIAERGRIQRLDGVFAAGMAPNATATDVANARSAFAADAGDASRAEALRRRYSELLLADKLVDARREHSAKALLEAARAAEDAPWFVSLLGEKVQGLPSSLEGFALGDALLAARDAGVARRGISIAPLDAEIGAIDTAALALVARRLDGDPRDLAARAFRAHAALARHGAPRVFFGPGRLDAIPAAVLDDLAAARALPAPLGGREAWLLADLLVAKPDASAAAKDAIEAASKLEPRPDARASLERVLATAFDAAGYASLAERLADAEHLERASFELSRFFARNGIPDALEHPELAVADPQKSDAWRRALGHDSPEPWFIQKTPAPDFGDDERWKELVRLVNDEGLELTEAEKDSPDTDTIKLRRDRVKPTLPRVRELMLALFDKWGPSIDLMYQAAEWRWENLATAIHNVFLTRGRMMRVETLAESMSAEVRKLTRSGYTSDVFLKDVWEVDGAPGLEVCRKFDARLEADRAEDPFLKKMIERGLKASDVELAASAVKGLRRLEELLEEHEHPFSSAERHALAFEAHRGMSDLARFGGPAVLALRAQLRKVAYPAPLGVALARLDLERAEYVASGVWVKPKSYAANDGFGWFQYSAFCAAVAARPPGRLVALEARLFDLAVAWARRGLVLQLADVKPELRERVRREDFEKLFQDTDGKETVRVLGARVEAAKKEGSLVLREDEVRLGLDPAFDRAFQPPAPKPVARSCPR